GKKSNLSTILLILAGILVLVGAIFIGKSLFGGGNNDGSVQVPNLVGKSFEEATNQGENGDFKVKKVGSKFCDDAEKNTVCEQNPEGGGDIERFGTVELTMSKGPKPAARVEVPDVLNVQYESAKAQLESKGFTVEQKTQQSDQTAGKVIDQDPKGGKKVAKGSTITLTVAEAQQKVVVPDVTTQKVEDATSSLQGKGLKVQTQEVENGDVEAGTVTDQTPKGGQEVLPGSTVTLTVAKAPAEPEKAQVPNLGGQSLKDAKKALQDLGLNVGNIAGPQDDNATVVASQPGAGTEVPKGQSVNLITVGGHGNGGGDGNDGGFFGGPNGALSIG
ncbi:PASTA domain-containing protein, partial [Streptomyces milbemycinicus]